ncbi:MAG: hypothetical protein J2P37_25770 [Ktedonobacteraceae bacterium]|nr:hypothetical protein [Ktedonobacteraceae bacterium]MBO0789369.1 hypothetical protein [Ktedonobacteraceae bacterium]
MIMRSQRARRFCLLFGCFLLASSVLLAGCTNAPPKTAEVPHNDPSSGSSEPVTYSTSAQDVIIRTLHGGGLQGSLSLSPQISIYGDGTYILGLNRQGKLDSDGLQQLLSDLVNTYGVLNFKRQQFNDIPDQNATFLELSLNGKGIELVYGAFSNPTETEQDHEEYQRLGAAITAINNALKGPTQPYHGSRYVLLARQIFHLDYTQTTPYWPLTDYTLSQLALYECGAVPPDDTSSNQEAGCMKYTIPQHAVLLNNSQLQALRTSMNKRSQGTFIESGSAYEVTLRVLLPDELAKKHLAMLGSAQSNYKAVPLQEGAVPIITPKQ